METEQIIDLVIARKFEDMSEKERRQYLREHQESRWNPGKARVPPRKRYKRK